MQQKETAVIVGVNKVKKMHEGQAQVHSFADRASNGLPCGDSAIFFGYLAFQTLFFCLFVYILFLNLNFLEMFYKTI